MVIIICIVACLASLLTFYSGFGLGTLLTPVFALFFPIETAVALTGVVHLLNGVFKLLLVYENINVRLALKFGLTAFVFSITGALLLHYMASIKHVYVYSLFNYQFSLVPVKVVLGLLLIGFAGIELMPGLRQKQVNGGIWFGGAITGFFGGLTGNQGALRTAFLLREGLSKEAFIATGTAIGLCIDVSRVSIYFNQFLQHKLSSQWPLLLAATASAFAGAWLGNRWLKKVSITFISNCVGILLIFMGVLLILGLI